MNASNKVRIGNTDVTVIEGQVSFTSSSDKRLKEDIKTVDTGLELINDLTPVSYKRINDKAGTVEMGLLAQDVAASLAKYGLSDSGMVHQANEDAYMSLRYNDLLAPMIKAIQELSEQSKSLQEQSKSLQEQSKSKDETIAMLEKRLESQQSELLVVLKQQQDQIVSLKSFVERNFVATFD
ncbi:tail fiber domain-containing protein [Luminiphilus sp.]|nr:tail fiber domain-containing protein [Luminiphilus sp.]